MTQLNEDTGLPHREKAMAEIIQETLRILDARATGVTEGLETGFRDFDHMTGGLLPGELMLLASQPGMGRTALAMSIVDYVAVEKKIPTLILSLDISRIELTQRILAARGKIDSMKLSHAVLSKAERARLLKGVNELSSAPLFIDDSPQKTVTEIKVIARRVRQQLGGLGLIVIDSLGQVEDILNDPQREQIAVTGRRLKKLAKELHLPILCLAELGRRPKSAKGKQPLYSQLQEFKAIEPYADFITFLYRKEHYGTEKQTRVWGPPAATSTELMIVKNRTGLTGKIALAWYPQYVCFTDFSDYVKEYEKTT